MRLARLGPRSANANGAKPNAAPPAALEVVPGRALEGLNRWAAGFEDADLPSVLLEAARALAAEVDKAPTASNLWGRYLDALRQLTDHVEALRDRVRDELAPVFGEIQYVGDVERWRADRYRQAVAEGDPDADRWTRLVPAACAEGRHRWTEWAGGARSCVDCDAAPSG